MEFKGSEGENGDNWSTASNWIDNKGVAIAVPSSTNDVIISAAAKVRDVGNQCKDMAFTSNGSLDITQSGMLVVNGTLTNPSASKLRVYIGDTGAQGHPNTAGGIAVKTFADGVKATTVFHSVSGVADNNYRWQAMGTTFSDLTNVHNPYGQSWIMYYNGYDNSTGDNWQYVNNGQGLTPFRGYIVTHSGAAATGKDFTVSGTVVNDASKDLSLYNFNGDDRWNFFANSWLAPIDLYSVGSAAFDAANADATVYFLNTGSRSDQGVPDEGHDGSSIVTDGNSAGQYKTHTTITNPTLIAPGQGFFIPAKSGASSGTLTLNYNSHVYTPAKSYTAGTALPVMRTQRREQANAEFSHITVNVIANEHRYADETHIYEGERFTYSYDNGCDARKAYGMFETSPQLFARAEYGDMALYATPDIDGTLLGFRAGSADEVYTLTFSGEQLDGLTLTDLSNNVQTELYDGAIYIFNATNSSDAETRFRLNRSTQHGGTTTDIEDGTAGGVKVLVRDGEVELVWNNEQGAKNKDIRLYDATGKLLYEEQGTRNKEQGASGVTLRFTLPQQGVYLLRIGTTTRKIVW